jgi:hypothetical protein
LAFELATATPSGPREPVSRIDRDSLVVEARPAAGEPRAAPIAPAREGEGKRGEENGASGRDSDGRGRFVDLRA